MDRAAVRCLVGGLVLCLVGAVASAQLPALVSWLTDQGRRSVVTRLLVPLTTMAPWIVLQVGAALIAAAVVLEVLLRRLPSRLRQDPERNVNPE